MKPRLLLFFLGIVLAAPVPAMPPLDDDAMIERLAAWCRFRNCAHETEPGCAVTAAIEAGELSGR